MKLRCFLLGSFLGLTTLCSHAGIRDWTNTLGGDWNIATNWSPNFVPGTGDTVNISADGTYTVTLAQNANFYPGVVNVGGGNGTQTLMLDNGATMAVTNGGTNTLSVVTNGVLVLTNGGLAGSMAVENGGQFILTGPNIKFLYGLTLVNRGTMTWSNGGCYIGSTPGTSIANAGLWQLASDNTSSYGGGLMPTLVNSGIIRKIAGNGSSGIAGFNFINQPGALVEALSGILVLSGAGTNLLGGSLAATAPGSLYVQGGTWTDAGGDASGTGSIQFTSGTYNLRTNLIPGLKLTGCDIYIVGTNTFQQAGTITNMTLDGATLHGLNTLDNGTLTMNSGNMVDQLTVRPAGQLAFASAATKLIYGLKVINEGTVNWTGGYLYVGGTPGTVISNGGVWTINGDLNFNYGGGQVPLWTNSGILRKASGTGTAGITGFNFFNQPGALVDCLSGVLSLNTGATNSFAGTFNATIPGLVEIDGGTWTDAGGTTTGTGTNRLNGGVFNFRTNTIPGLKFIAGTIYVTGTTTFQEAGAITNLLLEGSTLAGTNFIGDGAITFNSGSIAGQLTVLPGGQLNLFTAASKIIYSLNLINQGTVNWNRGNLYCGSTPTTVVSNGGLWLMANDDNIAWGGGPAPLWTNNGTLRKTGGAGTSSFTALLFYNQSSGLVQADTGIIQLPSATTNNAGTLRVNGGTLNANGTLQFNGGTLDGAGSVGANALTGGLISPGQGGPGLMTFTSGLNLGPISTLSIDGTGTVAGSQYDQLSVTGAVALSNATLHVTALPSVPVGTTFTIIANDGADAITGTFAGLPDNSTFAVSGQLFRIRYVGGSGNDVVLIRELAPTLSQTGTLSNGVFGFSGAGAPSAVYAIQATTNLIDWANIGTVTNTAGGNFNFSDSNAFRYPYRFYRTTN